MFKIFPVWFWKTLLILWGIALFLVAYQIIFERYTVWHLWLSLIYTAAIIYVDKKIEWIPRSLNKIEN